MAEQEVQDKPVEAAQESKTGAEAYLDQNKKGLSAIVGVIVVAVAGYLFYQNMAAENEDAATDVMWQAEMWLEKDSLNLAQNGSDNFLGFVDIAQEYAGTKIGKQAAFYAATIYRDQGDFDNAITFFESADFNDEAIGPMALGGIGDCYVEQGDMEKAASYYMDAADAGDNEFISPMYLKKAGLVYEKMGNKAKALDCFKKIKSEYSTVSQYNDIDKYINRVQ